MTATTPSGNPQPKRPPENTLGKIVIGLGLTGALVDSFMDNINSDYDENIARETNIDIDNEDNKEVETF